VGRFCQQRGLRHSGALVWVELQIFLEFPVGVLPMIWDMMGGVRRRSDARQPRQLLRTRRSRQARGQHHGAVCRDNCWRVAVAQQPVWSDEVVPTFRVGEIPLEGAFATYVDRELQPGLAVRPEQRDLSLNVDVLAKRRGGVCFREPPQNY
jgi:hypothetical protein